jgi:hypothetical protein
MITKFCLHIGIALLMLLSSCNGYGGFKLEKEFEIVSHFRIDTSIVTKEYISTYNKFSISIPIDWDIQEDYSDSIQGIFIIDNRSFHDSYDNFKSIAITKHVLCSNLKTTFNKELSIIKDDNTDEIIRIGKEKLNKTLSYWVLTESNYQGDSFINLTYFIAEKHNTHVFLLKATVLKTEAYRSSLSELNMYMHTFDLLPN